MPLGKTNARKERIWKFCNLSKTMDGWMGGWRLWQIKLDLSWNLGEKIDATSVEKTSEGLNSWMASIAGLNTSWEK